MPGTVLIIEGNKADKNAYPHEIYSLEEENKQYGWGKTTNKRKQVYKIYRLRATTRIEISNGEKSGRKGG